MAGLNGYVPLRRGILEHLGKMTDAEVKVYTALLCLARPGDGTVHTTSTDVAELVGKQRQTVAYALKKLAGPHGKDGTRYIKWEPAKNQHDLGEITIIKYPRAGTPYIQAPEQAPEQTPLQASRQHEGSTKAAPRQHTGSEQRKGGSNSLNSLNSHKKGLAPHGAGKPTCEACGGSGRVTSDDGFRCCCEACNGTGEAA